MPSATGSSWEKYRKNFADDEEPEKKITPLTDEFVFHHLSCTGVSDTSQGHPGTENLWSGTLRSRVEKARETNQRETNEC